MILKKQQLIIESRVERCNEVRQNRLKVLGIFTDSENGVEYLSICTEGNNWKRGLVDIFCDSSGLRFYGMEMRDNKMCLMLY